MAEEVEVSTETVPQNPDDDDNEDDADDEEDDEEVDEEVAWRLKTLSGMRKQLFRYLYTETYERDFIDLLCTLFLKRDLKFNLFYCFSDCCHEVAGTYNCFY